MSHLLKVDVNWREYQPGGTHPAQDLLDRIHGKLQSLRGGEKSAAVDLHLQGDECTYVYWGCGSCPDGSGGARVDAYCTSGGAEPDFSWCDAC